MGDRLEWETDGQGWPHREASRFVQAAGIRWHVQEFIAPDRQAPVALLIHGTGSSTHSWRGLAPLLAQHLTVYAMDLPGHGFTSMPAGGTASAQFSLPGMAQALGALCSTLQVTPDLVVGHSAGAGVAARMCIDGWVAPQRVISLNGALLPLGGIAGQFFSPAARLLAAVPFVPGFFSRRARNPAVLQRLIDGTGSTLDAAGVELYGRLVSSPGHTAGALGMMANWDLQSLSDDLAQMVTPMSLLAGTHDLTIDPGQARRVLALLPQASGATLTLLPRLGHLAHEERPDLIAQVILECLQAARQTTTQG